MTTIPITTTIRADHYYVLKQLGINLSKALREYTNRLIEENPDARKALKDWIECNDEIEETNERRKYSIPTKDYLYEQYIVQGKSTYTISEEIGIPAGSIYQYLKHYNIPTRSISKAKTGNKGNKGRICSPVTRNRMSKSSIDNNATKFGLTVEKLLCMVFKDIVRMPHNNKGFDFLCAKKYKIDAKGSMKHGNGWQFSTRKNTIADFFACIACGGSVTKDCTDITPVHFWLIPGSVVSDRKGITISDVPESLEIWSQYEKPLDEVLACCSKLIEGSN